VKFYVDADPAQRARRRHEELAAAGVEADLRAIEDEIRQRDQIDSTRGDSPLTRAADAVHVDTTGVSPDASWTGCSTWWRPDAGASGRSHGSGLRHHPPPSPARTTPLLVSSIQGLGTDAIHRS
jgi:hypothetical protein